MFTNDYGNQIPQPAQATRAGEPLLDQSMAFGFSCRAFDDSTVSCVTARALCTLMEHDLEVPEAAQLQVITVLGLKAQELFFAAAIQHPSTRRLRSFIESFVRSAVEPNEPRIGSA